MKFLLLHRQKSSDIIMYRIKGINVGNQLNLKNKSMYIKSVGGNKNCIKTIKQGYKSCELLDRWTLLGQRMQLYKRYINCRIVAGLVEIENVHFSMLQKIYPSLV